MNNLNENLNDIMNNSDEVISTQELFRELDYDYIGLRKLGDETYTYRAIDVRVQDTLELPIIIQWPDSVINFEFTIKPTDVYFSIYFVAAPENDSERHYFSEVEIETVKDKEKVTCDEVTEGTYKPPCEGVVFFVWDNTHDWSAIKNVSYKIEVNEPSFKGMEEERMLKSSEILKDVTDDYAACMICLADASEISENIGADNKIINEQIQVAEETVARKIAELQRLRQLEKELVTVINDNLEKIPGLCMRSLNKHLLSVVLGFLDVSNTSPVRRVNKLWDKICDDIYVNGPIFGSDYKYLATAKMRPRAVVLDDDLEKLYINSTDDEKYMDDTDLNDQITKTDDNGQKGKKKKDYVNKKNHSDNEGESVYSDSATDDSGDAYTKRDLKIVKFPIRENATNSTQTSENIAERRVRITTVYDIYPHLHPEYGQIANITVKNDRVLYERYLELLPLHKDSSKKTKKKVVINDTQITNKKQENEQNDEIVEKKKEKKIKLPKVAESKSKVEKKAKLVQHDTPLNTTANIETTNTSNNNEIKQNITQDEFIRVMDIAEPIFQTIGILSLLYL
jgi:hypothetical protein